MIIYSSQYLKYLPKNIKNTKINGCKNNPEESSKRKIK